MTTSPKTDLAGCLAHALGDEEAAKDFSDISVGGEFELFMTSKPNESWGNGGDTFQAGKTDDNQ